MEFQRPNYVSDDVYNYVDGLCEGDTPHSVKLMAFALLEEKIIKEVSRISETTNPTDEVVIGITNSILTDLGQECLANAQQTIKNHAISSTINSAILKSITGNIEENTNNLIERSLRNNTKKSYARDILLGVIANFLFSITLYISFILLTKGKNVADVIRAIAAAIP